MVTFTLPAQLRALAYANPVVFYNILFKVCHGVLKTFAKNDPDLGGDIGACGILHTNNRRMDYHPHLHYIVPGCALNRKRKQWRKLKRDYLFNGKALASMFRARILAAINAHASHHDGFKMPGDLPKKWNVQCKQVGKGLPALKYLSRYLYRGVISEKDLVHYDSALKQITFGYRHSKSGEYRYRTLSLADFLWHITMQVLPKGLRRARDYGLLHGNAKSRLILLQTLLQVKPPPRVVKLELPYNCCRCRTAMRVIGFLPPGNYFPS